MTRTAAKPPKQPARKAAVTRRSGPDPRATPRSDGSKYSVETVLAWLKRTGTKSGRDSMARYAIPSGNAFGVSVGALKQHAKRIGPNHELAVRLWETGWYEARMLASFIDEPERVTALQMERWCRDFDNWAIVDTVCFALFERSPHAWSKVEPWAARTDEFQKRAAFALIWSLSVHDKKASDKQFEQALVLIERAATDERNFVKKAVNMALRAVGKRNAALNDAAVQVARRLARSPDATARWVGRDARRELESASVKRRSAARSRTAARPRSAARSRSAAK